MNCIAIDNDPQSLKRIDDFCSEIDFLNLINTFANPLESVTILNNKKIDLIFLEVQMPQINGIEFIKTLSNPPLLVFITDNAGYAVTAFEINAIDYIVKPIDFFRFFKAVNRAYELNNLRALNRKIESGNSFPERLYNAECILVKIEYSTIKINLEDIVYIEGLKDYVKIVVADNSLLTKTTMKKIEDKLPSDRFIRIHRSYIVSIVKIEKIEKNRVVFGKKMIPIGNQYKESFNRMIDKYKL